MKHIAIEGMDGVGKTTTCRLLAERLGYSFIEKPLHFLLDADKTEWSCYFHARNIVNASSDRVFTAWFYCLSNIYLYEKFKYQNIITDRHIVSNYCWSGGDNNSDIYDLVLKKIGKPFLTVVLYASPEVLLERLKRRNPNDANIEKVPLSAEAYNRMIFFCETKKLPYFVIDTTRLTPEETAEKIIQKIGEIYE